MEVLVEEDWIWWNEEKNQVATKSGKATTVLRSGEAILEDGLRVWKPGDCHIQVGVGGANLPIDQTPPNLPPPPAKSDGEYFPRVFHVVIPDPPN